MMSEQQAKAIPEPLDIDRHDCPHCRGGSISGTSGTYTEGVSWRCPDCNGTGQLIYVNGRAQGAAYMVAEASDGQLYDAELAQDVDDCGEGYIEGVGPVWVREEGVVE
jgi:hypothetical protein